MRWSIHPHLLVGQRPTLLIVIASLRSNLPSSGFSRHLEEHNDEAPETT